LFSLKLTKKRKKQETYENKKAGINKNIENMDNLIDYIWCRLSEKYIKLSKAFRNMDITIVYF